jgi:hypothetical protein
MPAVGNQGTLGRVSGRAIADALDASGIRASRGGTWHRNEGAQPLARGSYLKLMYQEFLISARPRPMNYPLMVMKIVISFTVPQDVARGAFIVHEPAESSSADAT